MERVHHISQEKLHMKKLRARWVPRLLTVDLKRTRKDISAQCFAIDRFVTVDETWMHYYTPESKQQSKHWTMIGKRAPKKAKTVLLIGKVMATVLWDSQEIILIDYLGKKGKKDNRGLLRNTIRPIQRRTQTKAAKIGAQKSALLRFELIQDLLNSPDLAPSDFFLWWEEMFVQ
jgi:hypothetical protein